jgi:hypothetical protein
MPVIEANVIPTILAHTRALVVALIGLSLGFGLADRYR